MTESFGFGIETESLDGFYLKSESESVKTASTTWYVEKPLVKNIPNVNILDLPLGPLETD